MDSDYTIREATLDDQEAVMRLNPQQFGGFDYFPALFNLYVTQRNSKSYVLVKRDQQEIVRHLHS